MERNLVIGASTKEVRYSNMAIRRLLDHSKDVVAIGLREGIVDNVQILTGFPHLESIDTVLLYINPKRQVEYYDYIVKIKPRRVIFNPGTENQEFWNLLQNEGIECVQACSLVLLSTGAY